MHTASRNQRSWVTTSSVPRRAARWRGQPVDRLDVEVVGRLVEQQQLGRVEQQPRERDRAAARRRTGRRRRVDAVREAAPVPTPPSSPSSTPRNAAVARPLVLGALADEHLADRPPRVELVALRRAARRRGRRSRVSAPASGVLDARDQRSSVDLPSPLRADDADALARRDAERDVREHRAAAVALGDAVEVDEVARAWHRRASSPTCAGREARLTPGVKGRRADGGLSGGARGLRRKEYRYPILFCRCRATATSSGSPATRSPRQTRGPREPRDRELGDFTTTPSILKLTAVALPVGVAVALLALGLLDLIGLITHLVYTGTLAHRHRSSRHQRAGRVEHPGAGGRWADRRPDGTRRLGAHPRPWDPGGDGNDPVARQPHGTAGWPCSSRSPAP